MHCYIRCSKFRPIAAMHARQRRCIANLTLSKYVRHFPDIAGGNWYACTNIISLSTGATYIAFFFERHTKKNQLEINSSATSYRNQPCWRITTRTVRKLGNTVSRNVKCFTLSKRVSRKYGPSKQSPIIQVHTSTEKLCCVFLSLVPCWLSKAHRCEMCVLKTSSRGKGASSTNVTRVGKLGSMAVFCRKHYQNFTRLG